MSVTFKIILYYLWLSTGDITSETLGQEFSSFRQCESWGYTHGVYPVYDERRGNGRIVGFTCFRVAES